MRAHTSALKCVKHRMGSVPARPSLTHPQIHPFACSHMQPKAPCVFSVGEGSQVWGLWRCYHTALLTFGDSGVSVLCGPAIIPFLPMLFKDYKIHHSTTPHRRWGWETRKITASARHNKGETSCEGFKIIITQMSLYATSCVSNRT